MKPDAITSVFFVSKKGQVLQETKPYNLRTEMSISSSNKSIDYKNGIISLGFCFAVNRGNKRDSFKFVNNY